MVGENWNTTDRTHANSVCKLHSELNTGAKYKMLPRVDPVLQTFSLVNTSQAENEVVETAHTWPMGRTQNDAESQPMMEIQDQPRPSFTPIGWTTRHSHSFLQSRPLFLLAWSCGQSLPGIVIRSKRSAAAGHGFQPLFVLEKRSQRQAAFLTEPSLEAEIDQLRTDLHWGGLVVEDIQRGGFAARNLKPNFTSRSDSHSIR
ncbi:uncharacterized protein LOC119960243 [Scyliorhinus canicula]|uniref:uncharacterized protein LOC119960243 n=1 Tax=Scyliorhinus canicula TaxID=7830 RepID=UPI0018F5D5A5|nr:uncharacterized protein LOC119960243 [Scyliorhinus canicula]